MPRRTEGLMHFDIKLDRKAPVSLDRQISQGIRDAIVSGVLRPGDRLPATRQVASYLGVARATADLSYKALIDEGYLNATPGRGTFVSSDLPVSTPFQDMVRQPATPKYKKKTIAKNAQICKLALSHLQAQKNIPLAVVSTSADASPGRDFSSILEKLTKKNSLDLVYNHPAGFEPLRVAISKVAARLRGVRCTPEQVIVTSGSQLGLTMTLMALFNEGDEVWFENPGYPLLRGVAKLRGVNPVYVPVDCEGLEIDVGKKLSPNAKGVYLTPSHQCPMGMVLSMQRRLQLLRWASETGAWIIEDDYDSELRYDGNLPYPSLQGMDTANNVIYVGTFSKMLFPGLRIGYLVVPPDLVETFQGLRLLIDRQSNEISQNAVAQYIDQGLYEAHVRKMRQTFEARRNYLLEVCKRDFGDWGEFLSGEQGMCVTFIFKNQAIDDTALWQACLDEGVETRSVSSFYAPESDTPKLKGLVLGFGFFTNEQILAAVSRIGFILRSRFAAFGP